MSDRGFNNLMYAIICMVIFWVFVAILYLYPVQEAPEPETHGKECVELNTAAAEANGDTITVLANANGVIDRNRERHSFVYLMKYDAGFRERFSNIFVVTLGVLCIFFMVRVGIDSFIIDD